MEKMETTFLGRLKWSLLLRPCLGAAVLAGGSLGANTYAVDFLYDRSNLFVDGWQADPGVSTSFANDAGGAGLCFIGEGSLRYNGSINASAVWVDYVIKPLFISEDALPTALPQNSEGVCVFVASGQQGEVFVVEGLVANDN